MKKIGLKPAGSNYDTVKRKISELDLDTSHMTANSNDGAVSELVYETHLKCVALYGIEGSIPFCVTKCI